MHASQHAPGDSEKGKRRAPACSALKKKRWRLKWLDTGNAQKLHLTPNEPRHRTLYITRYSSLVNPMWTDMIELQGSRATSKQWTDGKRFLRDALLPTCSEAASPFALLTLRLTLACVWDMNPRHCFLFIYFLFPKASVNVFRRLWFSSWKGSRGLILGCLQVDIGRQTWNKRVKQPNHETVLPLLRKNK